MAKKRATGGGRKEADHQIRLTEMARLILDGRCSSPQKAARQVASRVVGLGDEYDWRGQPRIRNVDALASRLRAQWARRGRGETLLAAERADRNKGNAPRKPCAQDQSISPLFAPHHSTLSIGDALLAEARQSGSPERLAKLLYGLGKSTEQIALELLGRPPLISMVSVSDLYPEIKAALNSAKSAISPADASTVEFTLQGLPGKVRR